VVDISPKVDRPGYPIYLREQYMKNEAPAKNVERYVPSALIKW
jgi:hypothetical protein